MHIYGYNDNIFAHGVAHLLQPNACVCVRAIVDEENLVQNKKKNTTMVINFTNVTSIFGLYFCNGLFHYYHSNHYIVIYVDVDILLPVANGTKTENKNQ